ncbi:polygalacturonate 4-alpha-galacturonosyltransferase-like [Camellia sinensis]|uniref:polygalacturonate 4-alpha-galacturonosyltransferase-like n=1 Tax=Camellia sinensis TaxID=4442 RepID=UPI001035CB56|nr:polygalacturonate 4-alpha-galacturonosyltransferase-like [Camellia sinensis]
MRDQIIMARVYISIANMKNKYDLAQELQNRLKESQRALGEVTTDADLPHSAPEKIKTMGQLLSKIRGQLFDCKVVTGKLRAMLQSADEQVRSSKKQSTFLSQLAAKTIPNGVHCLSMRLTIDYYLLPPDKRKFPKSENLENPKLYHYALFSDNVLAASVVVNSTITNAKEPEKHVFHLVTDKLNFGAMNMWFLLNPPGKATIHVENVDEFKWLNSSYCPVLRQLESSAMKEYYFKADHSTAGSSNLKYRNPKYLSMLNHLRFYLPQVYPKLDKILFLDDDIVVQKDLTGLWSVDLRGKVNGAVETCGESFHRFDKYLNFSNPHIARNFDPNACGWAYGMNFFDLEEWKKKDITGIYHKLQNMKQSNANIDNRNQLKTKHRCGSKSLPVRVHEATIANGGQLPELPCVYKSTHFNDVTKQWISPECEENYDNMIKIQAEHCSRPGVVPITPEELSVKVLKPRSGYVKGLGLRRSFSVRTTSASTDSGYVRRLEMEIQEQNEQIQSQKEEIQSQKEEITAQKHEIQVSSRSTRGYGSIAAREWYAELPDTVRDIVDDAGFGPFCAGLSRYPASRTLIGALVER